MAEPALYATVGPHLWRQRLRLGWQLHYAAARLGIEEATLRAHEAGLPIPQTRYRRIMKVYNRAFHGLTHFARRTGVFR